MPANIDSAVSSFIAAYEGGGARANKFRATSYFPDTTLFKDNAKDYIGFSIKATSIPASNVGAVDVAYFGRMIKVAGDRVIDDWSITIYNDTHWHIRNAFENWLHRINAHENNVSATGWNAPNNYYADGWLKQFDREHTLLTTYEFKRVFPTTVADIGMDWSDTDSVEEFEVTLAVNWWNQEQSTPVSDPAAVPDA